jgi:hypothetical protein
MTIIYVRDKNNFKNKDSVSVKISKISNLFSLEYMKELLIN